MEWKNFSKNIRWMFKNRKTDKEIDWMNGSQRSITIWKSTKLISF
jgi:uncharacterized protein (TIGR01602 family)